MKDFYMIFEILNNFWLTFEVSCRNNLSYHFPSFNASRPMLFGSVKFFEKALTVRLTYEFLY